MNSIYKEEVIVADHDSTLISLQNISKTFGEVKAVNDISIDVKRGELITFIGPSGCGKTTLLRTIAGFNQPKSGDIYLEGNRITDLVPEKRETGMDLDRKSTRLNSSHVSSSYVVFCLKKKNSHF